MPAVLLDARLLRAGDFNRTLKQLVALATGRPLVGASWLEACGQAGMFMEVGRWVTQATTEH